VGMRRGVSFSAADYRLFNQYFDSATGVAIEQYWMRARGQQEQEHAEYVGVLAHELRNALATARMAFAILKASDGVRYEKAATILERSLGRLTDVVDQTLLAVRLESQAQPEQQSVNVRALLCEL